MTTTAAEHRVKARRLLEQANQLSADDAPESVIHLCYYAMFHAAMAVLLCHRQQVAITHTGLIGAFGRLARDLGEAARQQGRALNRAEDLRLRSDYGVVYDDLPVSAATLREEADSFLVFCETLSRV